MYKEKVLKPLEDELKEIEYELALPVPKISFLDKLFNFITKKASAKIERKSYLDLLKSRKEKLEEELRFAVDSSPQVLLSLLEYPSKDITLDESDLAFLQQYVLERSEVKIGSPEELIGVHKSNYLMNGGIIQTPKSTGAKQEKTIEIKGKEYPISNKVGNDTTHISFNGPVETAAGSLRESSWVDSKYVFLAPFRNIDPSNIINIRPEDTQFDGDLRFRDFNETRKTILLCIMP